VKRGLYPETTRALKDAAGTRLSTRDQHTGNPLLRRAVRAEEKRISHPPRLRGGKTREEGTFSEPLSKNFFPDREVPSF